MQFLSVRRMLALVAPLGVFLALVTACEHQHPVRSPGPTAGIKPRPWKITVGPHPCAIVDDQNHGLPASTQAVSIAAKHTISWKTDANESLYLVLHVDPACPKPFGGLQDLGMKDSEGNELYLLTGDAQGNIDSGKVSENACACDPNVTNCEYMKPSGPEKWQIKYDQYIYNTVGNVSLSCDGWIIIEK
jgi:hypothetical protein